MPTSLEKLQKFLKLETERGYDNRAVVGGLDKILPWWEKEARQQGLEDALIQSVVTGLSCYQNTPTNERAALLDRILSNIPHSPPSQAPDSHQPGTAPVKTPAVQPSALVSNRQAYMQPIRSPQPPKQTPRPANMTNGANHVGLGAPLTVLPGIGPRHAETLAALGLKTLGDLLYYFPRRYMDYSQLKSINRVEYGEELTIIATVYSSANRAIRGGMAQMTEVVVTDTTGFLRLNWFNQPWITNRLKPNTQIVVSGKVDQYLGRLVMNNPEWEPLDAEHLHVNRIVPVYSLTANITQHVIRRMMYQTISYWAPRIADFLPTAVRESAGLAPLSTALQNIHFPDNNDQLEAAHYRLSFDEIFLLQLGVLRQKQSWESVSAKQYSASQDWIDALIGTLPYTLTNAQAQTISDIRADLISGRPMNRLLQGDVGSGKTVVAAVAAAIITQAGAQTAFMAPTSILAEQHYRSLLQILSGVDRVDETELPLKPDEIALLIGDTSEIDKRSIREGLAEGSIKLVVGTHALIEDPVIFKELQFVVVDEQHRFGVAQRAALRSKGENPHLLVMTATPIPRSLALTVYGDLDISVMDEMPAGRIPIITQVLHPIERERAYQLILSEINKGHQAFIIYPLIEKGERDESKAAVEEHDRLQKEIFPHLTLGLMHGRLKPEEKDNVMNRFRNGEFNILVSTSVVEVGVDIPNATIMLIEGANRFGLAQLHQFRGRVGRGDAQSYCLLIPETEDAVENERLAVMAETNDGFVLAEKDLQQRGPGEFLGTRQAGFSELRLASLTNVHIIEKARALAQSLFKQDPNLADPENQPLLKMLQRFWGNGKGDIS